MNWLRRHNTKASAKSSPRLPSEAEISLLQDFQGRLLTAFDSEKHRAMLEDLWHLLTTGLPEQPDVAHVASGQGAEDCRACGAGVDAAGGGLMVVDVPDFSPVNERWTSFGFQQQDPASDIRGGGLLSVEQLIYFATEQRDEAMAMLRQQRRESHSRLSIERIGVSTNYPWAAAGIGITRMLAELFSLVSAAGAPNRSFHTETKLYWQLSSEFHELYSIAFRLMDAVWQEMGATYMQFQLVNKEVRKRLATALNKSPTSVDELADMLNLKSRRVVLKPLMSGMMDKQPQDSIGVRERWKTRFFVLEANSRFRHTLSYFATEKAWETNPYEPKGRLVLHPMASARAVARDTFIVNSNGHMLQLKVSTKSLADKWITAINTAVEAERTAFAEQEEQQQRWKNNHRTVRSDSYKLAPVPSWTEADGGSVSQATSSGAPTSRAAGVDEGEDDEGPKTRCATREEDETAGGRGVLEDERNRQSSLEDDPSVDHTAETGGHGQRAPAAGEAQAQGY
uniref:PH domain-containing protein n=1 Tax=Rhizochromulina marina TaxID=1034831 RepID=A0A7S2RSX2_9STRA